MPYGPEDDEEDDVTGAFVRGPSSMGPDGGVASWFTAPRDDTSDVSGSGGRPVAGATPAAPNAASSASVGKPSGSVDDLGLQPIPYNPPTRPTSLAQAQSRLTQDDQNWEKLSQPLDRADYQPSRGRRIVGSIAGALVAAGSRNPNAGWQLGTSVLDAPYNRAEQSREQGMSAAGQQLSNDRADYEQQDRDYENGLRQYNLGYDYQNLNQARAVRARAAAAQEQQRLQSIAPGTQQPDDPANPMGSWHAVTVGGKQVKMSGPPADWLKSPKGIDAQRDYEATRLGLTGNDRKFYLANGKLREPSPTTNIHVPSAEAEQYNDWKSAFRSEHGRAPNAEEISAWKRSGGGAPDQVGAIVADATQQKQVFANKYERDNKGNYVPIEDNSGPTLTPAEFASKIDSYRTGANKRLAKMGYQIDDQGNVTQTSQGQAGNSTPQIPNGGGKKLDADTAKLILKAAGGDKDKAREIAKKNNWKF